MPRPNFRPLAALLRIGAHKRFRGGNDAPAPGAPAKTTDRAKAELHDDYLIVPIVAVVLVYLGSAMLATAIVELNSSPLDSTPIWTEHQQ